MIIWTAFLLGLVVVRTAGTCGPLALALPGAGGARLPLALSRLGYNLGRVTAYILIGLLFGVVGQTVAFAGLQRWLSLVTGAILLAALFPISRRGFRLCRSKAWPSSNPVSIFTAAALDSRGLFTGSA